MLLQVPPPFIIGCTFHLVVPGESRQYLAVLSCQLYLARPSLVDCTYFYNYLAILSHHVFAVLPHFFLYLARLRPGGTQLYSVISPELYHYISWNSISRRKRPLVLCPCVHPLVPMSIIWSFTTHFIWKKKHADARQCCKCDGTNGLWT